MPWKRTDLHKISSQTEKKSHHLRNTKAKAKQKGTAKTKVRKMHSQKTKKSNFESDLLLQMKEKGCVLNNNTFFCIFHLPTDIVIRPYTLYIRCRYNGKQFIDHLKAGVQDRLHKRGKPPRMVRYFFYCAWAHALLVSLCSLLEWFSL